MNLFFLAAFCIFKQISKLSYRCVDCLLIPLILSCSFLGFVCYSSFVLIPPFLSYPSTALLAFPLCNCPPQFQVSFWRAFFVQHVMALSPTNCLYSFYSPLCITPFSFSLNLVWKYFSPLSKVTSLYHPLFIRMLLCPAQWFSPRVVKRDYLIHSTVSLEGYSEEQKAQWEHICKDTCRKSCIWKETGKIFMKESLSLTWF